MENLDETLGHYEEENFCHRFLGVSQRFLLFSLPKLCTVKIYKWGKNHTRQHYPHLCRSQWKKTIKIGKLNKVANKKAVPKKHTVHAMRPCWVEPAYVELPRWGGGGNWTCWKLVRITFANFGKIKKKKFQGPCWVAPGGGVTQHGQKKWKMLKMAWKWSWLISTMLSYPPPYSTCTHIQTDSDYNKCVERLAEAKLYTYKFADELS